MGEGYQIGRIEEIRPIKELTNDNHKPKPLSKEAESSPETNTKNGVTGVEASLEPEKNQEKKDKNPNNTSGIADDKERKEIEVPWEGTKKLVIRVDPDTGKPVFEIKNPETGEVIKQIPPEELVELEKKLPDIVKGLLINNMI